MRIDMQHQGAVTVVKPQGPLNHEEAESMRACLTDVSGKSLGRFVIDMASISFVDSQGLEVLLDTGEELEKSGQVLKLCGVNETLREVLELTELAEHFEHYEDATTAVRSFL